MSLTSHPLVAGPRHRQFIGDLESLLRRLRVPIGSPESLDALASQLESNSGLRSDLFALCNAISRMSESDLSPDELLGLVACAAAGPEAPSEPDGGPIVPEALKAAFLPAFRQWQARTESLSSLDWSEAAPATQPTERLARVAASSARNPRRPANEWAAAPAPPSEITAGTPIGDLTISQLRNYLEEIEQRVGRLQPYLESLRADLPSGIPAHLSAEPTRATASAAASVVGSSTLHRDAVDPEEEPAGLVLETGSDPELQAVPLPEPLESGSVKVREESQALNHPPEDLPQNLLKASEAGHEPAPDLAYEPVLPVRGIPGRASEHILFRVVSEPAPNRSVALLWVSVGLALLLPAAYYGKKYVTAPPAALSTAPPPAPAYTPPSPDPADVKANEASETPADTSFHALKRRGAYTTHLEPHAVHMAAEAARAQSQDSSATSR